MIYAPIILWALIIALSSNAQASEDIFTTELPQKRLTKLEAGKVLMSSDNKTPIFKCRQQVLSDKLTLKNKPKESK